MPFGEAVFGTVGRYASVFLRLALGAAFLSGVADRFGLWGPAGTANVAWGDFQRFTAYTARVNPWAPAPTVPALAWAATDMARHMIARYGMSDKLGTVTLDRERQPLLMQIQAPQEKGDYSEETAREIDCEVRRIVDEQYERVKRLLAERKAALLEGAKRLLVHEVISGADLKAIMDKY